MAYAFLARADAGEGGGVTPPGTRPHPRPDVRALHVVQRIRAYVEAHYAEQISLRDVARELGYSAPHLTHTFRRLTGTAVTAWIIKRRIRAAQQLLIEEDASVASVCERVGFNDLCYFTRQFVRLAGVTPRRYRIAARANEDHGRDDCTRHSSESRFATSGSSSNRSPNPSGQRGTASTYRCELHAAR